MFHGSGRTNLLQLSFLAVLLSCRHGEGGDYLPWGKGLRLQVSIHKFMFVLCVYSCWCLEESVVEDRGRLTGGQMEAIYSGNPADLFPSRKMLFEISSNFSQPFNFAYVCVQALFCSLLICLKHRYYFLVVILLIRKFAWLFPRGGFIHIFFVLHILVEIFSLSDTSTMVPTYLKGQSHAMFGLWFFRQTSSPGPLLQSDSNFFNCRLLLVNDAFVK